MNLPHASRVIISEKVIFWKGNKLNLPHHDVAGKLYTIGGVQAKGVDQYDVETDTWSGNTGL